MKTRLTYIISPESVEAFFAQSIADFLREIEHDAATLDHEAMMEYVFENRDALRDYADSLRWQLLDRTKYIEILEQELARVLALLP